MPPQDWAGSIAASAKAVPTKTLRLSAALEPMKKSSVWRIDRPKDPIELNQMYQGCLNTYNTFRPHMGLNYLIPEEKLLEFSG